MLEELFGTGPSTKMLEFITEQALESAKEIAYEDFRSGARLSLKNADAPLRGKSLPDMLDHFTEIGLLKVNTEGIPHKERKYTINLSSMLLSYIIKTDVEYVKIVSKLATEKKARQMKQFDTMRQMPKTKEGEQ